MVSILKVICYAFIISFVFRACTSEPNASAADIPVHVAVDETEFEAVFVPAGSVGPIVAAPFDEAAF